MNIKTTKKHKKFWTERKIDWEKDYLSTWNHPHRQLIIWALRSFHWMSLWEVGCGPGANLVRIVKEMEGKGWKGTLGGSDVNADAIEVARKTFTGGKFHVESVEDMLLSDQAVDVMLSDAALIYIGPTKIKKAIGEMVRISRNHIVLCEFHSTNWWKRLLLRLKTGYNAYDYRKLLEEAGCYDIKVIKMAPEFWPGTKKGDGWFDFGHIIVANVTHI